MAHTCFNRIDIPVTKTFFFSPPVQFVLTFSFFFFCLQPYTSYDTLAQKLTIAIEETMGFGAE